MHNIFNAEEFFTPDNNYYPVYSWMWNGILTKEEIKKQLDCELFPVTLPDSFCISDIFLACRDFLLGKEENICGKVYGFLSEPYSADKELKIRYEDIKASANEIKDGFIPERIRVGTEVIGPSDWLYAALELLCEGKDETIITKKPWQIDFDQFPILKTLKETGFIPKILKINIYLTE